MNHRQIHLVLLSAHSPILPQTALSDNLHSTCTTFVYRYSSPPTRSSSTFSVVPMNGWLSSCCGGGFVDFARKTDSVFIHKVLTQSVRAFPFPHTVSRRRTHCAVHPYANHCLHFSSHPIFFCSATSGGCLLKKHKRRRKHTRTDATPSKT